jgi:uncharacterized protein (TIGR04255 family)
MPSIDELFPPSPREVYERAPLIQVACELRFPHILKIEQPPVEFQERIRQRFPLFEKGAAIQLPQGQALSPEVLQIINAQLGSGTAYQFLTEDRVATVSLTPGAMALSTTKYTTWQAFVAELNHPLAALDDCFRPSFFSRIGLRYIDAINRDELGLANRTWSDLLRPEILGELAFPTFESFVESVGHQLQLKLPDGSGSVTLRYGYANVQGKPGLSYMIDFDFFQSEKTEVRDARTVLDHFNRLAGRAFRRCIRDALRDALRPRPLA